LGICVESLKENNLGKDLPKMIMFRVRVCDWLSETKMIIVRDSFFRKTISIVLLSFIVIINQPRAWIVQVDDDPIILEVMFVKFVFTIHE
jgi:hypothetical protein